MFINYEEITHQNKVLLDRICMIGGIELTTEVLELILPEESIKNIIEIFAKSYNENPKNKTLTHYFMKEFRRDNPVINIIIEKIRKVNNIKVKEFVNCSRNELEKEFSKSLVDEKVIIIKSILPCMMIFYYLSNNIELDSEFRFCVDYRNIDKELIRSKWLNREVTTDVEKKEIEIVKKILK